MNSKNRAQKQLSSLYPRGDSHDTTHENLLNSNSNRSAIQLGGDRVISYPQSHLSNPWECQVGKLDSINIHLLITDPSPPSASGETLSHSLRLEKTNPISPGETLPRDFHGTNPRVEGERKEGGAVGRDRGMSSK